MGGSLCIGGAERITTGFQSGGVGMIFNSLIFVVFFAIVLILHAMPLPWRPKKINLLIASYIFSAQCDYARHFASERLRLSPVVLESMNQ